MSDLSVSVIMPTFNRDRYIGQALDSLLRQTVAVREIIVIDDGSTDRTAEVVASKKGPISLVRKQNEGKPASINRGLKQARGAVIWVFDDDDVALPNALEMHIALLAQRPEIDFTYGPYFLCSPTTGNEMSVEGISEVERSEGWNIHYEHLFRCHTHFNSMLVRKHCYDQVGPWQTDLIRCQDHEMVLRLSRRFVGAPISSPSFWWRRHSGVRGAGANQTFPGEQVVSKWYEYRKKIFQEVWRRYELEDYLPAERRFATGDQQREAIITRAVVMACHGLWDFFADDMERVRRMGTPNSLNAPEREVLHRLGRFMTRESLCALLTHHDPAINVLRDNSSLTRELERELMRSIFWNCHRLWAQGERRAAVDIAALSLRRLSGTRIVKTGLNHFVLEKLFAKWVAANG